MNRRAWLLGMCSHHYMRCVCDARYQPGLHHGDGGHHEPCNDPPLSVSDARVLDAYAMEWSAIPLWPRP